MTLPSPCFHLRDGEHGGVVVLQLRVRGVALRNPTVADDLRVGLVRVGAVPAAVVRRAVVRALRHAEGLVCRHERAVQEAGVGWVVIALHGLQVVALEAELRHVAVACRQLRPGEVREGRLLVRRAHVGPDQVAGLDHRVGDGLDLVLERLALRRVRQVRALAGDVEFPGVIDAAQAILLVAAEEQRRPAVRAEGVEQTHPALAVTEGDEVLAQRLDAHWLAVRPRQLFRERYGQPEAAEELTHRGLGIGIRYELVVFFGKHGLVHLAN